MPTRHKTEFGDIYLCDAIELCKLLPDQSVDCCIVDPAYSSMERWRSTGTTTRLSKSKGSSNEWFTTVPNTYYLPLFDEFYRVLKPGSHLYIFCDEETRDIICYGRSVQSGASIDVMSPILGAKFKYWKALIHDKVFPGMGYHYRAQHEFIIMAEKVRAAGKHRKLNDLGTGDVLQAPRLKGKEYYPTQKPTQLVWKLINQSTNEGDTVLDPMVGGGTTAYAAKMCGRKFIVGDINEEAVRRTLEWVNE